MKDSKFKRRMAKELDVDFDELTELFSEQTLSSVEQSHIIGGAEVDTDSLNGQCINMGNCSENCHLVNTWFCNLEINPSGCVNMAFCDATTPPPTVTEPPVTFIKS